MYGDFLQQLLIDGDVSNVENTLNSGYNIHQTDAYGMTYLHCAIFRGLLKEGLDIPKDIAKLQQKIIQLFGLGTRCKRMTSPTKIYPL